MSSQHPGESYRKTLTVLRASGGGACNLLIRRVEDRVEILFHADPGTGALLSPQEAIEAAQALRTAAEQAPEVVAGVRRE